MGKDKLADKGFIGVNIGLNQLINNLISMIFMNINVDNNRNGRDRKNNPKNQCC